MRKEAAKILRADGWSYHRIGQVLNVNMKTAYQYINGWNSC